MLLKSKTRLRTADDGHGRCAPLPFYARRSISSPAIGERREARVPRTAKSAAGSLGRGWSSYVVKRRILKKVTPARRRVFYKLCIYFRGGEGGVNVCTRPLWKAVSRAVGTTVARVDGAYVS